MLACAGTLGSGEGTPCANGVRGGWPGWRFLCILSFGHPKKTSVALQGERQRLINSEAIEALFTV